ncbi:MAG TPA: hypothetical protein VMI12_05305 [Puia sp.]|nr:hypothetical protein [Puia sp.]
MIFFSTFSIFYQLSVISQYYFDFVIMKIGDGPGFHIFAAPIFVITSLPVTILNSTIIKIDKDAKTITFKNLFWNSSRVYHFNELQGYVHSSYRAKGGSYEVIYLIKDSLRIERIAEAYYSNFDELKNGFLPLKNMGKRSFNYYYHLKILFRSPVYD